MGILVDFAACGERPQATFRKPHKMGLNRLEYTLPAPSAGLFICSLRSFAAGGKVSAVALAPIAGMKAMP